MKQFLFLALCAAILISCNDASDDNDTSTMDTTINAGRDDDDDRNMLEVSNQIYKGIENGDSALLKRYIANDAVDHGANMDGSDLKGDGIVSMLADVKRNIPDINVEVIEQAANDDHVFALIRISGTLKNAFWGMPAGHKMDSRSVDVIKIRDGKAVDHWGFMDQAEVMKMMQSQGANKPDTARR